MPMLILAQQLTHQQGDRMLSVMLGVIVATLIVSVVCWVMAYRPRNVRLLRRPEVLHYNPLLTGPRILGEGPRRSIEHLGLAALTEAPRRRNGGQ